MLNASVLHGSLLPVVMDAQFVRLELPDFCPKTYCFEPLLSWRSCTVLELLDRTFHDVQIWFEWQRLATGIFLNLTCSQWDVGTNF